MSDGIADRRGQTRYLIDFAGSQIPALIGEAARRAVVRNLSLGGAGLLVDHGIAPGNQVIVQLYNSGRDCWHLKAATVTYALPRDDECWAIGCSFLEPLSPEDYQGVIAVAAQNPSEGPAPR
jgi:hypothetical protein